MCAAKHSYCVALWLNGSIVVNHAGDSGFKSKSVPYHIFGLFFVVFTRLGIRLGLGLVFLGLGIVLVYLAYDAIVLPARDI